MKNYCMLIEISLKFVPKDANNNEFVLSDAL